MIHANRLPSLAGGVSNNSFLRRWDAAIDACLVRLKMVVPTPIWSVGRRGSRVVARGIATCWSSHRLSFLKGWYLLFGLPHVALETSKARDRRIRQGFFEKYCRGRGLDICYGGDLLSPNCRGWEWFHGDAHYIRRLKDEMFDFVYSSHALEHMEDPATALRNWWRVTKPGGYLILYIPHRDLLEQKTTLPSKWNPDHKHFFLPDRDESPHTIGLVPLIQRTLHAARIVEIKRCDEGYEASDPAVHPRGEYSIEAIIQKILPGSS